MKEGFFNVIREDDAQGIIEIYGPIGSDFWDGTDIKSVQQQIMQVADCKQVVVRISSFGGDVSEALGIYELLRSLGEKVVTECIGMNASAATIIAMAGNARRMSKYGGFLIHKCSSIVSGNENEMESELKTQHMVNETIAQLYVDRAGCEKEEISALMEANNGNGRWLDIDEAMSYGFITEEITPIPHVVEFVSGTLTGLVKHLKNNKAMKKKITTFALLCAVLACHELEAKDDKVLLDDEQLGKVNDHIKDLTAKLSDAEAKTEKAKQDAQEEVARIMKEADAEKAKLQDKVAELTAILNKIPAATKPVLGNDVKDSKTFEESWKDSDTYRQACEELGMEA